MASTQLIHAAPDATARAATTVNAKATLETLTFHVIPMLPLGFTNKYQARGRLSTAPIEFDCSHRINLS